MTIKTGTSERPDLPLAVVIGAGGMGMSAARRLGDSYRVAIADINPERVEERAAAMREEGYDAQGFACDITDTASIDALVGRLDRRGPLRALVHVAAISPSMGDWRQILTLNLVGAANIENAFRRMATTHTAAVFISSMAAHLFPAPSAEVLSVLDDPLADDFFVRIDDLVEDRSSRQAYSLAKLAVTRMCARRAAAWGRRGARIVSMSPGMIATPMGALEFTGLGRAPKLDMLERSPVPREGTMVETADAIEFLISSRASFITGTDLLVDGGVTAVVRFPDDATAD